MRALQFEGMTTELGKGESHGCHVAASTTRIRPVDDMSCDDRQRQQRQAAQRQRRYRRRAENGLRVFRLTLDEHDVVTMLLNEHRLSAGDALQFSTLERELERRLADLVASSVTRDCHLQAGSSILRAEVDVGRALAESGTEQKTTDDLVAPHDVPLKHKK